MQSLEVRYERYRRWCIHVLGVYPASFCIWRQIKAKLSRSGRIAVLDNLVHDDVSRSTAERARLAQLVDDAECVPA